MILLSSLGKVRSFCSSFRPKNWIAWYNGERFLGSMDAFDFLYIERRTTFPNCFLLLVLGKIVILSVFPIFLKFSF